MKKVTFSITVVVLLAMIVGLIGYDRFSTSQNAKKYQLEEKTTTTTKEETTKTKKCTCGKTLNVKKRRILKIIKKMYKEKVLQERKDNNSDK